MILCVLSGNEAVHPGEIDLKDYDETIKVLFELLNLIVDSMIESPKKVDIFYNNLPENKLQGIETRDKN